MSFDSQGKPWFQPPDYVFGPVWTLLYFSMAGSIIISWINREELENPSLVFGLFAFQLILNLSWTSVFNSENYWLSLLMLLSMIAATTAYAYLVYDRFFPWASVLVWPYIAWLTFASILNVWYLQEAI